MSPAAVLDALFAEVAGRALAGLPDDAALLEGEIALDSVAVLELVVGLDERLGIALRADDIAAAFRSAGSLRALVSGRVRPAP
jgi:acyl carrier protein